VIRSNDNENMKNFIPAVVGALAAFLFVRKETRGKSLDQLAQETSLSL